MDAAVKFTGGKAQNLDFSAGGIYKFKSDPSYALVAEFSLNKDNAPWVAKAILGMTFKENGLGIGFTSDGKLEVKVFHKL
jgi:hypothetical protein